MPRIYDVADIYTSLMRAEEARAEARSIRLAEGPTWANMQREHRANERVAILESAYNAARFSDVYRPN